MLEQLAGVVDFRAVERDEVIRHMRARVKQCRRLAAAIVDNEARRSLLQMADEIEADIGKLEDETGRSAS